MHIPLGLAQRPAQGKAADRLRREWLVGQTDTHCFKRASTLKALLAMLSFFWMIMENSSSLMSLVSEVTWWVKVRVSVEIPWDRP